MVFLFFDTNTRHFCSRDTNNFHVLTQKRQNSLTHPLNSHSTPPQNPKLLRPRFQNLDLSFQVSHSLLSHLELSLVFLEPGLQLSETREQVSVGG
jgi:hypothetical protein